jgi:hypothetical protein
MQSANIKGHITKITESYSSILQISANHTFNLYDSSILEKCITGIEHIFKASYIIAFNHDFDFDTEDSKELKKYLYQKYLRNTKIDKEDSLNRTLGYLLTFKKYMPLDYYTIYCSINPERNKVTHKKESVSQEDIVKALTNIKPIINWFFSQIEEYDWEERYIGPSHSAYESSIVERVIKRVSEHKSTESSKYENQKVSKEEYSSATSLEKVNTTQADGINQISKKSKAQSHINQNVLKLFIGLLIISIGLAAYSILKTKGTQKGETPEVISNPESRIGPSGIDQTGTKASTDTGRRGDVKQPVNSIIENEKGVNKMPDANKGPEQPDVSKYINNTELKNKEGSNEMAVMIVNDDNSINSGISQKVASVFLKNAGYSNTTSLLSRQFVTDGLFGRVFSGGGVDKSKYNFGDYTDYICLGKIEVETEQSDVRSDMIKVVINLELMVVRASNGGETDHLSIPVPYNTGIGFSKQQAIEVATENIVKYLKTYKHEN